jgi:outer membrane protein OmpA-like peptidoglycan-associated protein
LTGVGGWDVYSFALHDDAKPKRVLFLKGELINENGQILEDVELEMKNINTNEVTTVRVEEGAFVSSLTLAKNDDVLITVKKEGFAFHSTYVSAEDTAFSSPSDLNIELESLEEGRSFTIEDIYFEHNSYQINPVARQVLIEFVVYLKLNKTLVIEINGFTDNIGTANDNLLLSKNRAKAVYDLITISGIYPGRLSYNGYGEQFPKADNATEKGRANNFKLCSSIICPPLFSSIICFWKLLTITIITQSARINTTDSNQIIHCLSSIFRKQKIIISRSNIIGKTINFNH